VLKAAEGRGGGRLEDTALALVRGRRRLALHARGAWQKPKIQRPLLTISFKSPRPAMRHLQTREWPFECAAN
jgi:hypothetical protein